MNHSMHILLIETATERGVIAYGHQEQLLMACDLPFGLRQSHHLMTTLVSALAPWGGRPPLDCIAVGVGPGSYTGIRMGVSVAQTLAAVWQVPLVPLSSLVGFVPPVSGISYATVVDARIGGIYVQKGEERAPQLAPLPEAWEQLRAVSHLVTPSIAPLKRRLGGIPEATWTWHEVAPSPEVLYREAVYQLQQGKEVLPPAPLPLLYLRETEAERVKKGDLVAHSV